MWKDPLLLCLVIGLIGTHLCSSKPLAQEKKTQDEIRASLITKHNYQEYLASRRIKKQLSTDLKLPAPFVVSTSLNIADNQGRRGRSYPDGQGNTIVEGVRLPDDSSDAVVHRNGRFINNVFVANDAPLPAEVVISSDEKKPRTAKMLNEGRSFNPGFDEYYLGGANPVVQDSMAMESKKIEQVVAAPRVGVAESSQPREYSFRAGNAENGRPVYYVVEEPDSLHSDRSPYSYEPADVQDSFTEVVADFTHSGISQANKNDFVIKEHTYTMCPGCPTFSIPVPIPKSTLIQEKKQKQQQTEKVDYQSTDNKTFLAKIGDRIVSTVKGIQTKTLGFFDPILNKSNNFLGLSDDNNTLKEKKGEAESSKTNYLPVMLAGAAAAALGSFVFFIEPPAVSTIQARNFPEKQTYDVTEETTTAILESIEDATQKFETSD